MREGLSASPVFRRQCKERGESHACGSPFMHRFGALGCSSMGDVCYLVPISHVSVHGYAIPPVSSRCPTLTSVRPSRAVSATLPRLRPSLLARPGEPNPRGPPSSTVPRRTSGPISYLQLNMVFTAFFAGRSGKPTAPSIFVVSPAASSAGRAAPGFRASPPDQGDGLPDAQHCPCAFPSSSSCRTLSASSCGSSVSFVASFRHSFLSCPALIAPAGDKKKPAVPYRGPPAWCRLWRRAASINDAPRAVIPL